MSFWTNTQLFPPILVRLLARHPKAEPLTELEIADVSRLSPHQIWTISWCTNWDGIDIPISRQFQIGCGLDFCDWRAMNRARFYLHEQARLARARKSNWRFLRKSPQWTTVFEPMMNRYLESVVKK